MELYVSEDNEMKIQIPNMNLKQIAESGQCFRWKEIDNDTFVIPGESCKNMGLKDLTIRQAGDMFELSCSEDDWNSQWYDYFDMSTDYEEVKTRILNSKDNHAIEAYKEGSGIRILQQSLWEMIVTFLISQNNNIKRITASVEAICGLNGGKFPYPDDIDYKLFDDKSLGLGYRVPYLMDIYRYAKENPDWLLELREANFEKSNTLLQQRLGIGPKVANCICLFGLHHVEAFPIDTHVKQFLKEYYPNGFDFAYYEGIAGIIQQYLFYYELKHK